MTFKKHKIINPLLTLLAVSLTFSALETAFRIKAYIEDRKIVEDFASFRKFLQTQAEMSKGSPVHMGHMIRLHDNENIVYDLKPDLYYYFLDAPVYTNKEGFRDRDYPEEKGQNTYRIIGIGDSIMFGQGIPQKDDYLSILEMLLNHNRPEINWEAINTAVPDYNTVMEVETLKTKGLKYKPDMVIIGFCSNDLMIPRWMYEKADDFTLEKSFLAEFIKTRMNPYREDIADVPSRYRYLAGWSSYVRAVEDLKEMSRTYGFRVIVLFFAPQKSEIHLKAMKKSRELGFDIFDMEPILKEYMIKNNIRDYNKSPLTVSDGHPSSIGHSIAARALYNHIVTSGFLNSIAD